MSAQDNGGPAFPVSEDALIRNLQGMTLRDYFAAKAMQGILSDPDVDHPAANLAGFAYAIADAMLKARQS